MRWVLIDGQRVCQAEKGGPRPDDTVSWEPGSSNLSQLLVAALVTAGGTQPSRTQAGPGCVRVHPQAFLQAQPGQKPEEDSPPSTAFEKPRRSPLPVRGRERPVCCKENRAGELKEAGALDTVPAREQSWSTGLARTSPGGEKPKD